MAKNPGCEVCNKSSLSLLLLRPSPIAKHALMAPAHSRNISAEPASVAGLLPARLPTESRFALRLLRPGYVHVYIAKPPPRVANWLVYRVTEQADLIPEGHALFSQPEESVTCKRTDHIATGMKMLDLPQAHKIDEVWIAYSANLWDDTLRGQNKADAEVMQRISLKACGVNTFTPTAEKLKAQVIECNLINFTIDISAEQDFPFTSVAKCVDQLAAGLASAAAKHPKTAGKELAVVLRDPVGIAAELNSLRVRRNEPIKREFLKPEVVHPLNSSNVVLGLRKAQMEEAEAVSLEHTAPIRTLKEYSDTTWPKGTTYRLMDVEEGKQLVKEAKIHFLPYRAEHLRNGTGPMVWVLLPQHHLKAENWTEKEAASKWSKFARFHDEDARKGWVNQFDARMHKEHYGPLEKMEDDWFSAAQDAQTLTYFKRHFDPDAKISAAKPAVSSVTYAHESHLIHVPAPMTRGAVAQRYIAMLVLPIINSDAIALRTFIGNRNYLAHDAHIQLTADPGSDGMRDKTFDILKGFSELTKSAGAMQSQGWIGHALALYSIGQLSALTGAVLSVASDNPLTHKAIERLQHLAKFQKLLEFAAEGALKGNAPKMPILIKFKVNANEALAIMATRSGQTIGSSKSRLKDHRTAGTMVTLTLLTDTDAIRAAGGDITDIAHNPSTGTVIFGNTASNTAAAAAVGKTPLVSKQIFLTLYYGQTRLAAKATNIIRDAFPAMNRMVGANVAALSKTLDARLALGSMVIQAIGVWNGVNSFKGAKSDSARLDASYGILDSVVGFSGGALQMGTTFAQIQLVSRLGAQVATDAIARSIGIGAMKFLGCATGVAGGGINFFASLKKSEDQAEAGSTNTVVRLYAFSAYASLGNGVTSAALTAGAVAESLAVRNIGGAVVRTVALRLGANAVLATVGGIGLTVSGVGLILLGAGVAFQVAAIVLTPDDLQEWLAKSYFGLDGGVIFSDKRKDMFAKGNWEEERKALDEVINKVRLKNEKDLKPE
jgi:hypothetical protein